MKTIGIIHPQGNTEIREGNSLEELQAAVGGYIQTLNVPHSRAQVYVNEEGLLIGLPVNTAMMNAYGLHFAGPVVVTFSGRDVTQADLDKVANPTEAQALKMNQLYNWTGR